MAAAGVRRRTCRTAGLGAGLQTGTAGGPPPSGPVSACMFSFASNFISNFESAALGSTAFESTAEARLRCRPVAGTRGSPGGERGALGR